MRASSGWRPSGIPGQGFAWNAADGDLSTAWDSVGDSAGYWLEMDFGAPVQLQAFALNSPGDGVHDCKAHTLQAGVQVSALLGYVFVL